MSLVRTAAFICLALGIILAHSRAEADPFFNSSEPGCNGSDPNVLMCDDFESSDAAHLAPAGTGVGTWASENADVANSNGGTDVRTKGWAMRIRDGYPHSICGPGNGFASNCSARSILKGGASGDSALADHNFAPSTGPGRGSSYNEFYLRFYIKFSNPYTPNNNQKFITFNPCCANAGGIVHGGFGRDMSEPQLCPMQSCNNLNEGYLNQNQGTKFQPLGAALNHWQMWEIHIKLNTPGQRDGVFEWWANDCGANADQCVGTPTLRMRYTNVFYRSSTNTQQLGVLFWDIWGNPADVGTMLIDQIKVTKTGPIGFMGGTSTADRTGPAAPTNPRLN
jgi:hypothetical protein